MRTLIFAIVVVSSLCGGASAQPTSSQPATPLGPMELKYKWVYTGANLDNDKSVEGTIALMKRAKKAGFNGIVVADGKFSKWALQRAGYSDNVRTVRKACTDEGMQLIVTVAPMGYAAEFLALDPNLAEGMPVRDATFVVKDGKLLPDEPVKLTNGSLTEWKGDTPIGWSVDEPGTVSFKDEKILYDGKPTLRQEQSPRKGKGAARLMQGLKVEPWHYYHVSVMVKTEDCTSKDFRILAHAGDHMKGLSLNHQPPTIQKTMDWTRIDTTFNSLDNTEVGLFIGWYGPKEGKVWLADVKLEPGGFVNVLRRESLPVTVVSEDGKTTFTEGKDFSEIKDPKLGMEPNPGYFKFWHDYPTVTVPAGSRLKDGQRVKASYNYATTVGKDFQINCCFSEPKVYELLEKQAIWAKETAQPDAYFMFHDEMRQGGWDDTCAKRKLTCGQILADNISKCADIFQKADPGKLMVTWNDMFDPFHNAHKEGPMYLAKGNGPWYGSWEGLPASVVVMNWNSSNADSLKFFAGRGNRQILSGYYDTGDVKDVTAWLEQASKVKGICGVMYTTWVADYSKLEDWMKLVQAYEAGLGK
jgi:hypothetical protein